MEIPSSMVIAFAQRCIHDRVWDGGGYRVFNLGNLCCCKLFFVIVQ
jgi:hypothetical protein